jgi:cell division protein FtsQ
VERRRELRLQRRNERLRNAWRLLLLLGLSAGLGTVLLREGWTLRSADQVRVDGSRHIDREQVISASGLDFPQPLLSLNPRQLAAKLKDSLPLEEVHVSRWMAPPRLQVELVEREPVARAERRGPQGQEQGFVDRHGYWMSARQVEGMAKAVNQELQVQGWQERHRPQLSLMLQGGERLRSDLRQIRFEPNGTLTVRSARLGEVRLGPPDQLLPRRLEVLDHLIETLPPHVQGKALQAIDLTEPEQPELALRQLPSASVPAP